jgi:hypothetical protein
MVQVVVNHPAERQVRVEQAGRGRFLPVEHLGAGAAAKLRACGSRLGRSVRGAERSTSTRNAAGARVD